MITAVHGEIIIDDEHLAIDDTITTQLARSWEPTTRRPPWLPREAREIVEALERGTTERDIERFEIALARYLHTTNVLCAWMDWPRRVAWSTSGLLSTRLQELVPDVAGSGRRIALPNAIIEPIGSAPAWGALVVKGPADQVFQSHVPRLVARVAARIAPALERLIAP
jgi:hypothetical protein